MSLYKLRIEDLKFLQENLVIDIPKLSLATRVSEKRTLSYIISYPHFIQFVQDKEILQRQELTIAANLVYAWMPTVFVWKNDNFDRVLELLNDVKKNNLQLSKGEFKEVKSLINNSVVGTSKILHFMNPTLYPIWDSKINVFLGGIKQETNNVDRYFEYLKIFQDLQIKSEKSIVSEGVSSQIGYPISFARAFEMVLFLSDPETLKESKKIKTVVQNEGPKLPKMKRDAFIFISNLTKVTADPNNPITYKRDGYLLSEHYMTPSTIQLAKEVKQRRNLLISDNGNFTRIKLIAAKHDDKGLDILNTARDEMKRNGVISADTIKRRKDLMDLIGKESEESTESLDINNITKKQLSIDPDYMIGMEDFAIPAMMMSNLMHPIFEPDASEVLSYQAKTLSLYSEQESGVFGHMEKLKKVANFLVLHAYDYESALQASTNSLDSPKDGIAISYGGPMHSKRWINSLEIDGEMEVFEEKLPESYLIAQSLTLGIINGNPSSVPFHILGVGTPILIAIIGYQLRHSSAVSIDSTAPFKDAMAGKLYGDKKAYIKMDMYRVAAIHLIDGTAFDSASPFFTSFESMFPSDWDGLRDELNITSDMNFKQLGRDLEDQPEMIEKYIPFFSKMRSGSDAMMLNLRMARSGHNFWILQRICKNIIRLREDPPAFKKWIEKQVKRYKEIASPKWGKAVEKTFELTEKHRKF
ncbi:MAG: hypothetical protein P8P74_02650 [Crocinitomicaceae bacterium]|nr:hypothetical protein [Crocinitomicaceae bacterium]